MNSNVGVSVPCSRLLRLWISRKAEPAIADADGKHIIPFPIVAPRAGVEEQSAGRNKAAASDKGGSGYLAASPLRSQAFREPSGRAKEGAKRGRSEWAARGKKFVGDFVGVFGQKFAHESL